MHLFEILALTNLDLVWSNALNSSKLFQVWLLIKNSCQKLFATFLPAEKLSDFIDKLVFILVCLLFFIMPAPYFANDKEWLALLVVAATCLRILVSLLKHREYKPCAIDMLVLAFLCMNVISTASSHYFIAALKGLAKVLVYVMSYFLFVSVLQNTDDNVSYKRILLVLFSLILAGFAVALYGLYQYKIGVAPLATWEDPNIEEKTTRVYSTLKNPNLLAGYLVPLVPLSLGLSIFFAQKKGLNKLVAFFIFLSTISLSLCCIFTGSRGGYMAIGISFFAFFIIVVSNLWKKNKSKRWLLLVCLVLVPLASALLIHLFPAYEHRIFSIFAGREHSSNSYRLNVYSASLKMFADSWYLGVGPGNAAFRLAYGLYMKSGFDALGTYCVPLEIAVETGVFGLLLFSLILLVSFARTHLFFWTSDDPKRWLVAALAIALLGMMVHGLVDTVFYRPQVQLIFWLLLAILSSIKINKKVQNS